MAVRNLLLLALAACALSFAAAQSTTGQQLSSAPGYVFGSDVSSYLKVSLDFCDISSALNRENPDWGAARSVYNSGKNSQRADGTLRTLRSWATTSFAGEPFYDMYAAYWARQNISDFLDAPISKSLDGGSDGAGIAPWVTKEQRQEQAEKGILVNLPFVYMMHEMNEGREKVAAGNTDPAKGGANNVDEVWAIYVGERPECNYWGLANKRAEYFGTLADCQTSSVNQRVRSTLQQAQRAANSGNLAAYDAASKEFQRLMMIPLLQSVIRYAEFAENDIRTGKDPAANQAEGYASFRTIAPLLYEASVPAHDAVQEVMYPGNAITTGSSDTVKAALAQAYPELGLSSGDIGASNSKQPGLGCNAPVPFTTASTSAGAAPRAAAAGLLAAGVAALSLLL